VSGRRGSGHFVDVEEPESFAAAVIEAAAR